MGQPFVYEPPADPISTLFVDDHIVVADKPSGLLSVPGRAPEHQDSLLRRLEEDLGALHVVHRLDMDTSGVIVFARHKDALRSLSRQFQQRNVSKLYHAIVIGRPAELEGVVDQPLRCDWDRRPRQMIDPVAGKPSQTRYRVLEGAHQEQGHLCSYVALQPITGRSHQLRVHMEFLGCPILGDRFYAPSAFSGAGTRLMLNAQQLDFFHEFDEKNMSFCSLNNLFDT